MMKYKTGPNNTRIDGITLDEFLQNETELSYEKLQFVRGYVHDAQSNEYHFTFSLWKAEPEVSVFSENGSVVGTPMYIRMMEEMGVILGVCEPEKFKEREFVPYAGRTKREIADVITKFFDTFKTEEEWRTIVVDYQI